MDSTRLRALLAIGLLLAAAVADAAPLRMRHTSAEPIAVALAPTVGSRVLTAAPPRLHRRLLEPQLPAAAEQGGGAGASDDAAGASAPGSRSHRLVDTFLADGRHSVNALLTEEFKPPEQEEGSGSEGSAGSSSSSGGGGGGAAAAGQPPAEERAP